MAPKSSQTQEVQSKKDSGPEWIMHDGKCLPVSKYALVEIRCRNGWQTKYPTPAHEWMDHVEDHDGMWIHEGQPADIVSYRVVSA